MPEVAVITGGARGIGFACAERLAADGHRIAIWDVDESAGTAAVDRLPDPQRHAAWAVDVTDATAVHAAAASVAQRMGPVTVLINNAGVLRATRILDIAEAEWNLVLDVCLKAAFLCSTKVLPGMREAGHGRIVNISSTAGKTVSTLGGAHYTAAKSGLLGLTRAIAKEVAPWGVTVNAVCPGLFATEMTQQTVPPEALDGFGKGFPIGRLGRPEEVAALVAFLASPDSAYITGAAYDINGGDLMV